MFKLDLLFAQAYASYIFILNSASVLFISRIKDKETHKSAPELGGRCSYQSPTCPTGPSALALDATLLLIRRRECVPSFPAPCWARGEQRGAFEHEFKLSVSSL